MPSPCSEAFYIHPCFQPLPSSFFILLSRCLDPHHLTTWPLIPLFTSGLRVILYFGANSCLCDLFIYDIFIKFILLYYYIFKSYTLIFFSIYHSLLLPRRCVQECFSEISKELLHPYLPAPSFWSVCNYWNFSFFFKSHVILKHFTPRKHLFVGRMRFLIFTLI